MIQSIITYLIIIASILYVLYSIYKIIFSKKEDMCEDCNCDIKKLKKEYGEKTGKK